MAGVISCIVCFVRRCHVWTSPVL